MKTSAAVLASFLPLLSGPAAADCGSPGLTVSPGDAISADTVTIEVGGDWPDSCIPESGELRLEGRDLFLDVDVPRRGGCFLAFTYWSVSAESPPLDSGTYKLHWRLIGADFCTDYAFLREITAPEFRFVLGTSSIGVPEGGTAELTVALLNPMGPVDVTVSIEGDPDLEVLAGSRLSFDDSNYSRPQTVTLAARQDGDYLDGSAVVGISAPGFLDASAEVRELDDNRPSILHVDALATGSGSGVDWTNAFTDLQQALAFVREYPDSTREIRVAAGVYRPTAKWGDRQSTFRPVEGILLQGGYAGASSDDPGRRHTRDHETVLSGDLNGDDGPDFANRNDNSLIVVHAGGLSASTVIDGFTITAGNRFSSGPFVADIGGAGIYFDRESHLMVRNCILAHNRANFGGGVRVVSGSPTFVNCVFLGNHAISGGAMSISALNSVPRVTLLQCTFVGNSAINDGGGLVDHASNTRAINCIFWGNSAGDVQGEAAQVKSNVGIFRHSCIQGWTGALGGDGNFGGDPLLEGPGLFRLSPGSPCIEAGAAGFEEEAGDKDIHSEPRLLGSRVDVGADEFGRSRPFRRGESNGDGQLDISDPVTTLTFLFSGGEPFPCEKAADANDDGKIDIADPIAVLSTLFQEPVPLPAPHDECGEDPVSDVLTCDLYEGCD